MQGLALLPYAHRLDDRGPQLEYDRLYVVTIMPGQTPVTMLLRYGEPYVAGSDFGLRRPSPSASRRDPPIGSLR